MHYITYTVAKTEYGSYSLSVSLNGMRLAYDLSDFFKDVTFAESLFDGINRYVRTLSIDANEDIFNTFLKLYEIKDSMNYLDVNAVNKIENKIGKVVRLFNLDNFKLWLNWEQSKLFIPENILDEFIFDPDMNMVKEKTYTKKEYIGLIGIVMLMRACCPLYIDYYNYIRHVTDFFYYKIFNMFIRSDIYISEDMDKLREYTDNIQKTIEGASQSEYLIINKGFSSDDIIDNSIAEIIFVKLITNDFYNKKNNIISFIFQTIKFKISFGGIDREIIKDKKTKNDPDKEDISYFEDYRKTSDISIGIIVELQHALDNIPGILSSIGITNFDMKKYSEELVKTKVLMNNKIHKTQIILLGWLLHRYINPRALYYIEVRKLIELLVLAKLVLWDNDHKFMAVLMTSYKDNKDMFINVALKNNLSKSYLEPIMDKYSYLMYDGKSGLLEKTVAEISKEIVSNTWIPTASSEELTEIRSRSQQLNIPESLYSNIASYIEFCNR